MLTVIFLWFTAWTMVRVVKTEPAVTVLVLVLWLLALLSLLFDLPRVEVNG